MAKIAKRDNRPANGWVVWNAAKGWHDDGEAVRVVLINGRIRAVPVSKPEEK